jgi:methylenetetrahydrofolate dehydrogenase (NADP+)/methenyltetrahydrofolate cyclohydrolase
MATLLDGKALAKTLRDDLAARIRLEAVHGHRAPGLVTILVGDDPASRVYVGG